MITSTPALGISLDWVGFVVNVFLGVSYLVSGAALGPSTAAGADLPLVSPFSFMTWGGGSTFGKVEVVVFFFHFTEGTALLSSWL